MSSDQPSHGDESWTLDALAQDGRCPPELLRALARYLRDPLLSLATAHAVLERQVPRDDHEERAREVSRRAIGRLAHIVNLIDPGSSVEVLLPVADETPAARPTRVLLIEDNDDLRAVLADLCRLWGHEVHIAANGFEGIATAVVHPPDVALIDIGLPDIDGFEVARRLRHVPSCAGTRLVAVTAYASAGEHDLATNAGFDLYVVKSCIEDMAAAIAMRKP